MSAEKTLIQFILDLLKDPKLLAEFKDDPQGLLAQCGLSDVSAEDVRDAIVLAQDNDEVSFDRDYNTGGGHGGGHHHTPPPPPVHHGEDPVKYIDKYVTNNHYTYNVDDRDTIVDNSINQNIDTGGGDFRQDIDTNSVVASGDGAVAAGDDIRDSTITTGNGNAVGDGNAVVNGDDNQVAFGDGSSADSYGDITADDGGAVAIGGGDADGDDSVNDSYNSSETTTTDETTTSFEDSFNTDVDSSTSTVTEDSGNVNVLNDADLDVNASLL